MITNIFRFFAVIFSLILVSGLGLIVILPFIIQILYRRIRDKYVTRFN